MPKSGGVVILMQPNLNNVEFIIGDESIVAEMPYLKAFHPFDEEILDFFNDLSKTLLKEGRAYSDVITFGFWCRKAALMKEKEKYDDQHHSTITNFLWLPI